MVAVGMSNLGEELLHLRGGATIPNSTFGQFNWTWPLAELTLAAGGVRISLSWSSETWQAEWRDIARAKYTSKSVWFHLHEGRGARFQAVSRNQFEPVLLSLSENDVTMERVKSTYRATWKL